MKYLSWETKLIFVIAIVDIIQTTIVLRLGLAVEANPIMKLTHMTMTQGLIVKLLITFLGALVVEGWRLEMTAIQPTGVMKYFVKFAYAGSRVRLFELGIGPKKSLAIVTWLYRIMIAVYLGLIIFSYMWFIFYCRYH